jgi:hypothetical protein
MICTADPIHAGASIKANPLAELELILFSPKIQAYIFSL